MSVEATPNAEEMAAGSRMHRDPRKTLLRDALVFQGKLVVDGLRDLVLCPIALGAAVIDFMQGDSRRRNHFYEVVHYGRRTERWINLFEAAERAPHKPRPDIDLPSIDECVDRFEDQLNRAVNGGRTI